MKRRKTGLEKIAGWRSVSRPQIPKPRPRKDGDAAVPVEPSPRPLPLLGGAEAPLD